MAAAEPLPLNQLDVISAGTYGEHGYPHPAWQRLRREQPVCFMEPPDYAPFWAITKPADIIEVSKQPDKFKSEGRFILFPRMEGATNERADEYRVHAVAGELLAPPCTRVDQRGKGASP